MVELVRLVSLTTGARYWFNWAHAIPVVRMGVARMGVARWAWDADGREVE